MLDMVSYHKLQLSQRQALEEAELLPIHTKDLGDLRLYT